MGKGMMQVLEYWTVSAAYFLKDALGVGIGVYAALWLWYRKHPEED